MKRRELELELLSLKFQYYTPEVRQCISHIVISERCEDTSDTVINGIFEYCFIDISSLLAKNGVVQDGLKGSDYLNLDVKAREFIRTFIDDARSYEGYLGDLEDDEFEALYRTTMGAILKSKRDRLEQSARERDRWEFFNKPDADADFARWRGRLLSPAQAVALSFGKDPNVVKPERLEPYRRVARSLFREEFSDRLDLVNVAVAAGELSAPMAVCALDLWAVGRGIDLPSALTGKATTVPAEDAAFWKAKYEAAQAELKKLRCGIDDLKPKSKNSIYKLILGMAIARFEHRTDLRSSATTAIRDALAEVELPLKDDAIREHLSDAADHLDFQWSKPIPWRRIRGRES